MLGHYDGTKLTHHFPSLYKLQVLLQLPILAWPQVRCMLRSLLSVISYYLNKPRRKPDSRQCERILLKMMMKRVSNHSFRLQIRQGPSDWVQDRETGFLSQVRQVTEQNTNSIFPSFQSVQKEAAAVWEKHTSGHWLCRVPRQGTPSGGGISYSVHTSCPLGTCGPFVSPASV